VPRPPSTLAKLARPRLHAPITRDRLLALLDARREHPLVWVGAGPGAGKTTLVASWIAARQAQGLWYQLDPGDSDPATFFYYLRVALRAAAPRTRLPPLLTPEYLADLDGFSRRWFRELFHRLPLGALCVFDNWHELAPDSPVHGVLAAAVREVPPGAAIVAISRSDPHTALAAAMSRDQVAYVGWDALRLSAEESRAIAASRGETDAALIQQLHEDCDGWAAGLTLMLERLQRHGDLAGLDRHVAREGVFDYFASQIVGSASEETRRVLLHTAYFPRVTVAQAAAVSGVEGAGRVLDGLYRRHLFVERRPGDEPHYQYHPLLRAFLRSEAVRALGQAALAELIAATARLLAAEGQDDEAIELNLEAARWNETVALWLERAPALLRQGRWQTLEDWAGRMPMRVRDANPQVGYWLGRSLLSRDPLAARSAFERAYAVFLEAGDSAAQLLAAVAVLEALYYEFRDFKAMDPWIARVADLLERPTSLPTLEDDLRVHSTLLMAASYRAPEHPILKRCAQCTAQLLAEPLDVNLRVGAISMLCAYAVMSLDPDAERTVLQEARRLLASPEVTPLRAAFCLASEGYLHYTAGRHAEALAAFDRCDTIAASQGLEDRMSISRLWRGMTQRRAGLLEQAQATIARLAAEPTAPSGQRAAQFALLKAVVAFDRGELDAAVRHGREAQHIAEQGGQFNGGTLLTIVTANIAIGAGELDFAADSLRRMRARVTGPVTANYLGAIALNEAWLAHRRNHARERAGRLRESLGLASDPRARTRMSWYPNALSELLPLALVEGIEPDTARLLARELGIQPAPAHLEEWPWPVRVRVLGPMELLVDGAPPAYTRKRPKRPLALLAAIIAMGGSAVAEQRVLDALWPQEDGDAAYRSLAITIRRLRELLGRKEAVRHGGGRLTLDPGCCWVDAWAFEQAAESGDRASAQRAIELYRGAFLEHEDAGWAVPLRERLRGKFIGAVMAAGDGFERSGAYEAALGCYRHGLDADALVEGFYQGMMRCYARLERPTEGVATYRRLQQVLSAALGVEPSAQTEQLYRSLLAA
jgi:ATP/maltotriose-dependent transcriptional regulator MalT/DNA-binding SARP family transcriptional activator